MRQLLLDQVLYTKNQVTYHFGDYDPKLELLNEEISGFYNRGDNIVMSSHIDALFIPLTYCIVEITSIC